MSLHEVSFYKVSGGGNDFIALLEPERTPAPEQVSSWCRRALSLGADGVFVLRREGPGKISMEHFNPDGGRASLCLNGTRCAGRLAFEAGWATGARPEIVIHTDAGAIAARRVAHDSVALEIPPPESPARAVAPEALGRSWPGSLLTVGVPHFVLPWPENLAEAPVKALGAALVHHPALGPEGANIDFVRFPAPDRLEIRTYERGVDAETLACGTGVMAAAAVGVLEEGVGGRSARFPLTALTAGGFLLAVEGEVENKAEIRRWSLAGDARIVARGKLLPEAATLPPPPPWSA